MDSFLSKEIPWTKANVLTEVLGTLSVSARQTTRIKRFVDYYFAHEKRKDQVTLSIDELRFVFEKCQAAVLQPQAFSPPRQRKLHSRRKLKQETVLDKGERVHGDVKGNRGWIPGWLTTQASNACVDLELDSPMLVTQMMVHAVNVKASPKSMELYAKTASGEWTLIRSFLFRDRAYEGSHGQDDYSKMEMFTILGDRSTQAEVVTDDNWELHPLAGPGEVQGKSDLYYTSKHWRWKIVNANGAHYVGLNDFSLFGREPMFPAPERVQAEAHGTGVRITWSFPEDLSITHFEIVAFPGGFGFHSNGGFFERSEGTAKEYYFASLSPGVVYQFQVIAVGEDGKEGVPSEVSERVKVADWTPEIEDSLLEGLDQESEESESEAQTSTHHHPEPMLPSKPPILDPCFH